MLQGCRGDRYGIGQAQNRNKPGAVHQPPNLPKESSHVASPPANRLPAVLACLLVSCVPHHAKTEPTTAQAAADKGFDMHAPYVHYHFAAPDMDFTFGSMVLGATSNGGCETDGAFYVASKITDGSAARWQKQRGTASASGGNCWGPPTVICCHPPKG